MNRVSNFMEMYIRIFAYIYIYMYMYTGIHLFIGELEARGVESELRRCRVLEAEENALQQSGPRSMSTIVKAVHQDSRM